MRKLIILTIACTFFACSDDGENLLNFSDCDELIANYKIYNGEEVMCQFYYTLTVYESEQYIELNSHCADLVRPYVYNENCEDICANDPYDANSACGKYLSGKEFIEIFLIEK